MRRTLVAAAVALAAFALPAPASADSGTFTSSDGPFCEWFGFQDTASMACWGYSVSARRYVRYHCDFTAYGPGYHYRCQDSYGAVWSGDR